ncbi:MAG: hypothetical protein WCO58_01280 [bacterium]
MNYVTIKFSSATDTFLQNKRAVFTITKYTFFSLIATYCVAIGFITFSVVAKKTVDNQIKIVRTAVGDLELQYLQATNNIDTSYAYAHGFVSANPVFASKSAGVAFLSMRTNADH